MSLLQSRGKLKANNSKEQIVELKVNRMAESLDGSQYLENVWHPSPGPPIQDFRTGTREHFNYVDTSNLLGNVTAFSISGHSQEEHLSSRKQAEG